MRLHAERKAVDSPINADLMEKNLNQTLARLRVDAFEDSWWRDLLNSIGHRYVVPDFLKNPSAQKWLADAGVSEELKSCAKAIVMDGTRSSEQAGAFLAAKLPKTSEETKEMGVKERDALVAILVAGYIASIPVEQQALAGMIQELRGEVAEGFEKSQGQNLAELKALAARQPPIVNPVVTESAKQELCRILPLRGFDADITRRKLKELLQRVNDGDLATASDAIKHKIRYWTARIFSMNKETLACATKLRVTLRQYDREMDLSIVDALIAETEGDTDKALHLLRDCKDSDSRSVWFGLLRRAKGDKAALKWLQGQDGRSDPGFFAPAGWLNWALFMAELEREEEASRGLIGLEDCWEELPILAVVEGAINAAMLLPAEFRRPALNGALFIKGVQPIQGASAERYHRRATHCFRIVEAWLSRQEIEIPEWTRRVADWTRWLQLMNPRTEGAAAARKAIKERMNDGANAVDAIPFAYTFGVSFDAQPLKAYLRQRNDLGGLDDQEQQAEFLLSALSLPPSEMVGYLERNRARLAGVILPDLLSFVHAEAMINSGCTREEAETVVGTYEGDLDKDHFGRLQMLIETYDHGAIGEPLRAQYEKTGSLIDLHRLISHLKMAGDWAELRPLAQEMFAQARTVENAMDVVRSLAADADFGDKSILGFLESNADLVIQSDALQTMKAVAHFRAGRLEQAKQVNDAVLARQFHPENFRLDLNIALASGNWERLGSIADRSWNLRGSLDAEMLLAMGQIAGQINQTDQALKLAKAAVDKAPRNPHVLSAAYSLYFQLGREEESNSDWLRRATQLSSAEDGPIQRVNVQEFVTATVPKRREQLQEMERKWLQGEIPMSVASDVFNVSLARLLLDLPRQQSSEPDGRRRTVLPIIAGGREPTEIRGDWNIGLDISSVLLLDYLDLLNLAIRSFHHVRLAPDVMEHLFREQEEARFHQPSRIKAAQQVQELYDGGGLVAADRVTNVAETLIKEVGRERATLLHLARQEGGKFVCSLPIYRAESLMEQVADTSAFEDFIVPIADFCKFCFDQGKIGSDDYRRARSLLERQGQTESARVSPSLLDGGIFLDELSLGYLLDAKVLEPITSAGIQIRILPGVLSEMRMLIKAGHSGEDLATRIDGVRHVLRDAIASGKASFLPRVQDELESNQGRQIRFDVTMSLLAGASACDAVCVDDRYINSRQAFVETTQREIPIVCVLDVLRYLVSQGSMDVTGMHIARNKLRAGGFFFILPDPDELAYWLRKTPCENGALVENAELRNLRQSMACAEGLTRDNWQESLTLISCLRAICIEVLLGIWNDGNVPPEKATKLSQWIWRNLMSTSVPARQNLTRDAYANAIRELASLRLGNLLLPIPTDSPEKHREYANWIEQDLLQPLWPANPDIVERALQFAREAMSEIDVDIGIDKAKYARFFLGSLPRAAQQLLIRNAAGFAEQCGIQLQRSFSIGADIKIAEGVLFEAVRRVYATSQEESIEDLAGKEVFVGLDSDSHQIIVKWLDTESVSQHVVIREMVLLSPDRETRLAALDGIRERLGPTAKDLRHLRKALRSGPPGDADIAELLDETFHGVAAQNHELIQMVDEGKSFRVEDIVPTSMAYYERFCGPNPGSAEPVAYLREDLIPYRKSLLNRDLAAGLDICALGALRDDLLPGKWIAELGNDTVWKALCSCDLKGNPFALLAGLDIALYRQDDDRFQRFAELAVVQLTDEKFGHQMGANYFELLQSMYKLVSNRINLLEKGALMPGYWKRMSAWMRAGLFVRALTKLSVPDTSDFFERVQQWAQENEIVAGTYGISSDARQEPMVFASSMPQGLRNEVLGRLNILRLRHEAQGHNFPKPPKLKQLLDIAEERGRNPLWDFPGPLEGHSRPRQSVPAELDQALDAISKEDEEVLLESLMLHSQLFSLGAPELERARQVVREISPGRNGSSDASALLRRIELASVIAAASGDTALSDEIGDAAIRLSAIANNEQVRRLLAVLLQAAVAFQQRDAWCEWLEEKLAEVSVRLPQESLDLLLRDLHELETILPAACWFHPRAKATALAGKV